MQILFNLQMKTILAITPLAAAVDVSGSNSLSPWVTDFSGMLAQVGCNNGPKQCGASNLFATFGEECGYGSGCMSTPGMSLTGLDQEYCTEVA